MCAHMLTKGEVMNDAVCDQQAPLEEIRGKLPLEGEMQELANFFKVFGELS